MTHLGPPESCRVPCSRAVCGSMQTGARAMAKYLLTFAAVTEELAEAVRGIPRAGAESAPAAERVLHDALNAQARAVAFYRSVMDGWDAPHRNLESWIARERPGAAGAWRKFIESGLLVMTAEECRAFESR